MKKREKKEVERELKPYLVVAFFLFLLGMILPYTPLYFLMVISGAWMYIFGRDFALHNRWKMLNVHCVVSGAVLSLMWAVTDLIYSASRLGMYIWWHSIFDGIMMFGLMFYFGYLGYFVYHHKSEWWEVPLLFLAAYFVIGFAFITELLLDAVTVEIFLKTLGLTMLVYTPVELLFNTFKHKHVYVYHALSTLWSVLAMIGFLLLLIVRSVLAVG